MRWSLAAALSLHLISTVSGQSRRQGSRQDDEAECPSDFVSFEVVTGYVYTAPADMLDSQPGTLMLTDCIDTCRGNSSCKSINYETGLCVLFSSSADEDGGQLTPSQFPVFTIYVQKNCLPSAASCDAAWSFDRVMNHELDTEVRCQTIKQKLSNSYFLFGQIRKRGQVNSRQECMEQCLAEVDFECRLVHLAHYGLPNNSVLEKLPVAILRHVDCQSSVLRSGHPVEGFCPVTHPLPTWQDSSESTSCWSSGSPVCGMQ